MPQSKSLVSPSLHLGLTFNEGPSASCTACQMLKCLHIGGLKPKSQLHPMTPSVPSLPWDPPVSAHSTRTRDNTDLLALLKHPSGAPLASSVLAFALPVLSGPSPFPPQVLCLHSNATFPGLTSVSPAVPYTLPHPFPSSTFLWITSAIPYILLSYLRPVSSTRMLKTGDQASHGFCSL